MWRWPWPADEVNVVASNAWIATGWCKPGRIIVIPEYAKRRRFWSGCLPASEYRVDQDQWVEGYVVVAS